MGALYGAGVWFAEHSKELISTLLQMYRSAVGPCFNFSVEYTFSLCAEVSVLLHSSWAVFSCFARKLVQLQVYECYAHCMVAPSQQSSGCFCSVNNMDVIQYNKSNVQYCTILLVSCLSSKFLYMVATHSFSV